MRTSPDGGTASGIWGPEFDDGLTVCPRCGEEVDQSEINVESFERFEELLCQDCFEARCETEEYE